MNELTQIERAAHKKKVKLVLKSGMAGKITNVICLLIIVWIYFNILFDF